MRLVAAPTSTRHVMKNLITPRLRSKVLITGGTGFISSRLALRCLDRGDRVRVLGQANNAAEAENKEILEHRGVEVTLASVTDRKQLFDAAQGIDTVFHLAAAQHEANISNQRFWDVNVTGTRNILEASVEAGIKIFVHGSTIGVYGENGSGEISEHSPLDPDNIYGVTKLEGERIALSFQEKLPIVILRISETYGPGDRRLIKLFKAIEKKILVVAGNGQNKHHIIYIDDLIDGFLLAASTQDAVGKCFVLAGKEAVTTEELVAAIARRLNARIPRLRVPLGPVLAVAWVVEAACRPIGLQPPLHRRRMDFFRKSFVFQDELAKKVLEFEPRIDLERGVAETAKWYSEQGYL
jgi:nucleoside-diphosphate-sugar epimerase